MSHDRYYRALTPPVGERRKPPRRLGRAPLLRSNRLHFEGRKEAPRYPEDKGRLLTLQLVVGGHRTKLFRTLSCFGKHVLTPSLALTSIAGATPLDWKVSYWDENLLQGARRGIRFRRSWGSRSISRLRSGRMKLARWYRTASPRW